MRIGGHEFDLSRSRDVIRHVTIRFPICHFLLEPIADLSLTVSEIFNVECDAMVEITLYDL